jgi:hypothetical protein
MRNNYILGLMSVMMFATACGKSMSVTAKSNDLAKKEMAAGKAATDSDGKLLPLSVYDLKQANKIFAFNDAANNTARSTIGSPTFSTGTSSHDGYVTNSNLVFRAIKLVPTTASTIQSVSSFKLVLRGVTVYAAADQVETVIGKQILCILDTKNCAGGKQDASDTNLNANFWKVAAPTLVASTFLNANDFQSLLPVGTDVVYSYQGSSALPAPSAAPSVSPTSSATVIPELTIDLQKLFNIADADMPAWIFKNSTVFDSTGNYRKFQFELGNNIYAREGQLELVINNASTTNLIENATAMVNPVNGVKDLNQASDMNDGVKVKIDSSKGIQKTILTIDEANLGFTDAVTAIPSDEAVKKLNDFSTMIVGMKDSVASIAITDQMDMGADVKANTATAKARASAVVAALIKDGVSSTVIGAGSTRVVVAAKSKCSGGGVCTQDRMVGIHVTLKAGLTPAQSQALTAQIANSKTTIFSASSSEANDSSL